MKPIIASVFFDMLSYNIGNIIFCIFKNFKLNLIIITARVYKLRLAEVNFLSSFYIPSLVKRHRQIGLPAQPTNLKNKQS